MRILIIGAGDIGNQLARRLSTVQHDLTVIENNPEKIQRLRERVDAFVIEGSGTSYRVLQQAQTGTMDLVAAVTDNDEVNLLSCKIAKKMGVPTTIARVRNTEFTEESFPLTAEELGVDHIIHPEVETAHAVAHLIRQSSATYAFEFEGGRVQVIGVRLDRTSPIINAPLANVSTYKDEHLRIVAVERNHQTIIPDGSSVLFPGDQIFAVCDHDYVRDFLRMAGKTETHANNIMIMGGGLIGQTIASYLRDEANIKVIEGDQRKAERIAELLSNALVIHGDGTDLQLLQEEGLSDMDSFIAVTGDDENNIISSLLARHYKVPQSIALVNKLDYLSVIPQLGVDGVVSRQLLTVNAVEHLIQSEIADIATPPGLDAQLIEFIAEPRSRITKRPLMKVRFPKGAIIGAVIRNDEVIIPHGNTQIEEGDKAVVFTLPEAVQQVDHLFEG